MLGDEETGSIWNHITGRAVYGPLEGYTLPVFNLLHMTAEQALDRYPGLSVAISDRPIRGRRGFFGSLLERVPVLGAAFRSTIVKEDTRLPTMDIGLGVWTESEALYYPMEAIQAAGGALIDDFDGRRLVVYVEPGVYSLDAFSLRKRRSQWKTPALGSAKSWCSRAGCSGTHQASDSRWTGHFSCSRGGTVSP